VFEEQPGKRLLGVATHLTEMSRGAPNRLGFSRAMFLACSYIPAQRAERCSCLDSSTTEQLRNLEAREVSSSRTR